MKKTKQVISNKMKTDLKETYNNIDLCINGRIREGKFKVKYFFKGRHRVVLTRKNRKLIKQYYRDNGYKVHGNKNTITISWNKKSLF